MFVATKRYLRSPLFRFSSMQGVLLLIYCEPVWPIGFSTGLKVQERNRFHKKKDLGFYFASLKRIFKFWAAISTVMMGKLFPSRQSRK